MGGVARGLVWRLLSVLAATAGCPSQAFVCDSDAQCPSGRCETVGFCSVPDEACSSGRRYQEDAGSGLAGQCVDASVAGSTGSETGASGTTTTTTTTATTTTTTAGATATSTGGSTGDTAGSTTGVIPRVADDLLVLYRFDAGSGNTVFDRSPLAPALDLTIGDVAAVQWESPGLTLLSATDITSAGPAAKVIDGCQATDEISIEAWFQTADTIQLGPARLITMSLDSSFRNFMLGHGDAPAVASDGLMVRLRTTATNPNGQPALLVPGLVGTRVSHVLYTKTAAGQGRLYVDGVVVGNETRSGDFSGWDATMPLHLGNEAVNPRPWSGTLLLIAVYGRALTPAEVEQNTMAGF